MSSEETHPPEEGFGADPARQVAEEAERYPSHEDPDELREDAGLGDEDRGRRGAPEGAPEPE